MQEKLYKAGLYGNTPRKNIRWGDKSDDATLAAYVSALRGVAFQNANGIKITLDGLLDEAGKYQSLGSLDGGEGPVFAYQPEDPAKIRRLLDEGLPEVMGRALSPQETEALVAKWQQIAEQDARNAFNVEQSGGVAKPRRDFASFALDEAERLYPDEVHARRLADAAKSFQSLITGNSMQTAEF